MRIFHSVASLHPSYGGPARSVPQLAAALVREGAEVGVWAPQGVTDSEALRMRQEGPHYLGGSIQEALAEFGLPDILHDHGIWLPHNHRIARYAAQKGVVRFVSARGMLEPWALKHKSWKKRLAWWLYQRADLQNVHCLHATSETEAKNIRILQLGKATCALPNGIVLPSTRNSGPTKRTAQNHKPTTRIALFIGRIYPVKGLPLLVDAWHRARPKGWNMQIVGPDEGGHRAEVEKHLSRTGLSELFSFTGPLEGSDKDAALQTAELFILPTFSESFGMAIAEALAHGLPVLTTTGAPWSQIIERRCGWWVEPHVEALTTALRHATSLDSLTLRTMGARGKRLVEQKFTWPKVAQQMKSVYEWALGRGTMPACVNV